MHFTIRAKKGFWGYFEGGYGVNGVGGADSFLLA